MSTSLVNIDINKIMTLSDNNFEISKIIIQLIKRKNNINLDILSTFNITGTKIMKFYKKICNENYDLMIEYISKLEETNSDIKVSINNNETTLLTYL
jgi:hypothetical protein